MIRKFWILTENSKRIFAYPVGWLGLAEPTFKSVKIAGLKRDSQHVS